MLIHKKIKRFVKAKSADKAKRVCPFCLFEALKANKAGKRFLPGL